MQKIAAMPEVKMAGISTNATPPDNGATNKFELLGKPCGGRSAGEAELRQPRILSGATDSADAGPTVGRCGDQTRRARGRHQRNVGEAIFPGRRRRRAPDSHAEPERPIRPITQAIPESTDWFGDRRGRWRCARRRVGQAGETRHLCSVHDLHAAVDADSGAHRGAAADRPAWRARADSFRRRRPASPGSPAKPGRVDHESAGVGVSNT